VDIKALGLSPAATACLEAEGIRAVEQLTATELLDHGVIPADLYEIVCQLNDAGLTLPAIPGRHIRLAGDREREILRLRLIEKLTLGEIAERIGISQERVRQLLNMHFGLTGVRR
jgi:hypothetical protein